MVLRRSGLLLADLSMILSNAVADEEERISSMGFSLPVLEERL